MSKEEEWNAADEDVYYAGTVRVEGDSDEYEELNFDDFALGSQEEVYMDESVRFSGFSNERNITEDEEDTYS